MTVALWLIWPYYILLLGYNSNSIYIGDMSNLIGILLPSLFRLVIHLSQEVPSFVILHGQSTSNRWSLKQAHT